MMTPSRSRSHHRYLRRLREGAAADGLAIHREDVQARLAQEVGLDGERLVRDIHGAAPTAFRKDLEACRGRGVRGFPTFLIRNAACEERTLRGDESALGD